MTKNTKTDQKYQSLVLFCHFSTSALNSIPSCTLCTSSTFAVKTCKIVDVYVGKSLKNSEKSVTVRITYGSDKKTLSGPEIDQCEKNILESLKSQINFSLRV